jgi:hypothetical protein
MYILRDCFCRPTIHLFILLQKILKGWAERWQERSLILWFYPFLRNDRLISKRGKKFLFAFYGMYLCSCDLFHFKLKVARTQSFMSSLDKRCKKIEKKVWFLRQRFVLLIRCDFCQRLALYLVGYICGFSKQNIIYFYFQHTSRLLMAL